MTKKSEETKDTLLLAAQMVLRRDGVRSLTLDAVAREAGVSKGGLIHHFPSKDALIAALVDRACNEMLGRMETALAEEGESGLPGRYTRAYIRANLALANDSANSFVLNLFELIAVKPDAFATAQGRFHEIASKIENDGLDPVLASILAAASDACWLEVLFGVSTPNSERLRCISERLIEMSYGDRQAIKPKRGAVRKKR
jgi:AcrR family transcriptional regulator